MSWLTIDVRSGNGGISAAALDEQHVLFCVGFDLLDKHFQEVGSAHAGSGTHLPIQGEGQLFCLLVERENEVELS